MALNTTQKNELAAKLIEFAIDEVRPEWNYLMEENKKSGSNRAKIKELNEMVEVSDAIDTILRYLEK